MTPHEVVSGGVAHEVVSGAWSGGGLSGGVLRVTRRRRRRYRLCALAARPGGGRPVVAPASRQPRRCDPRRTHRFARYHRSPATGPCHAGGLEVDRCWHVRKVPELARPGVEQPGIHDLNAGSLVGRVGEVERDEPATWPYHGLVGETDPARPGQSPSAFPCDAPAPSSSSPPSQGSFGAAPPGRRAGTRCAGRAR